MKIEIDGVLKKIREQLAETDEREKIYGYSQRYDAYRTGIKEVKDWLDEEIRREYQGKHLANCIQDLISEF